jgi:hypothetical protein
LEYVKLPPELVKAFARANALGNLELFEVAGERAVVSDDPIQSSGTLYDLTNFAFESKMTQPHPILFQDIVRVPLGEGDGIETSEGRGEYGRFDEQTNLGRASALAVGDGDTDVPHDLVIGRDRAQFPLGTAAHFLMPTRGGTGMTLATEQVQRPAGLIQTSHGYPEVTTAKAE